jgi:alkylhydroperoxidase family enzyme
MGRLAYPDPESLDGTSAAIIAKSPINLFRMLANNPGLLKHWYEFGEWIRWDGRLDARLRELAILMVGALTLSPYEFSHHVKIGRQFGVTDEDLAAVVACARRSQPAQLGETEALVLAAARELTENVTLSGQLWAELGQRMDQSAVLELIAVVGFYNMVVRVLAAVELDVEPEYEPFLAYLPELTSPQTPR